MSEITNNIAAGICKVENKPYVFLDICGNIISLGPKEARFLAQQLLASADYIESLSEITEQPQADEDGWIVWDFSNPEGPEIASTVVEAKFRDGSTDTAAVVNFYWHDEGEQSDIIAYKVIK